MITTQTPEKFQTWAFLELMGHRKLAGFIQETEIASTKFIRIDVPDVDGKQTTQFYSPASVYCMTPTTEDMVKAYASRNAPSPVSPYELDFPKPQPPAVVDVEDDRCDTETSDFRP